MEQEEKGADLGIKVAGQELNVKNIKSLNTIATLISMFGICCIGVFLYFHEVGAQQDKARVADTLKSSNQDIATILKESNAALKEQTSAIVNAINKLEKRTSEVACLNDPAMRNRTDARDFCRRIARDDR